MLTVKSLHAYYGNIHALKGVSLHVRPGEIVAIIGANGAGKTTLVHCICGLLKPAKGAVLFEDADLTRLPSEAIVRKGISLVPEGRQIFATLSVEANLEMGAFVHRKDGHGIRRDMDRLLDRFPVLRQRRHQLAGTLSGGEQQMLAICRALMARPRYLLLDEPSMGLAPLIVREIFDIIVKLRAEGRTILLIEQNARAALQIADRGYVLETGKIVLQGDGRDLLAHREVQRAYLGKGAKDIWEA